jgi:hypothetical protein
LWLISNPIIFSLQNGRLQQIAANRFSTPQDFIAILLQGFVLPFLPLDTLWLP